MVLHQPRQSCSLARLCRHVGKIQSMDGLVQKNIFIESKRSQHYWPVSEVIRNTSGRHLNTMRSRREQTLQLREHKEPSTLPENSSVTCNHISPNPGDLHYTSQEGDQHKNHFYKAYEN